MRLSGHLRAYVAGLAVVGLLSAGPVQALPLAASTEASMAGIHIDNFGKVNDKYFRGAQPKGDDFRALASLGVKMVIDLADEGDPGEEASSRAAGMGFVRIPMNTRVAPTPDVIAKFLSLVNDPANQPVYVHCMGGRHRTGVMTAVYRMTMEAWTPVRAFEEMKQYRFGADFLHPEFKAFVTRYVVPALAAPATK